MNTHKMYELALRDRDMMPVIAYGSAGTGKTYGAIGLATEWLDDKRKKVVCTRPNVSFAKENGFLPGTEREKLEPWIRPLEQNFGMHGFNKGHLTGLERSGRLTYIALEHIQGLTFDDTLLIVDECQNMSFDQFKVLLTRMGKYSKVVLCGDVAQTSPKFKQSGLFELTEMVNRLDLPVHLVHFTHDDILRSEQCKMWIQSFDRWEDGK